MWFDFSYDDMRGEKWGATRLIDMVRRLQPGIIIDNRLEVSVREEVLCMTAIRHHIMAIFVSPGTDHPRRKESVTKERGNPMVWGSMLHHE